MPTALVIQHADHEGLGLLADWLPAAGLQLELCRPYAGDAVPPAAERDALVVLGGPQSVLDGIEFLAAEERLLADAVHRGVPVLGICLGAQLLAVAAGGEVRVGAAGPERGAALVRKSDVAGRDPVFVDVPLLADVVAWHAEEISRLPAGAILLAAGSRYPHQAFRVGERAYGLQFHVEATPEMVELWARHDGLDAARLLPAVAELDLAVTWRSAIERFAALAR